MAAGVEGAGVIATDAAISIVIGIVKISVFGLVGVITAQVVAFALLIGIVALPGAFLAKAFVERMPVHVHTAILDAVVLLGGVFLVYGGALSLRKGHGHFTTGGIEDRIDSTLPPVRRPKIVPRS